MSPKYRRKTRLYRCLPRVDYKRHPKLLFAAGIAFGLLLSFIHSLNSKCDISDPTVLNSDEPINSEEQHASAMISHPVKPTPLSSPSTSTTTSEPNDPMQKFLKIHGPFTGIVLTEEERVHDTLQSGDDVVKFQSMNHSFCATWYHYQMMIGSHHKTGSILMAYHFFTILTLYFREWCNESDEYSSLYTTRRRRHIEQKYGMKGFIALEFDTQFQEKLQQLQTEGDPNAGRLGIIMQHIIRNPVDVVISRYNYHLSHPDGYYGRDNPVHVVSRIRDNLPCDKAMYIQCCELMGISPDKYSIANMLTRDLKVGIECEYDTFQKCYYADLYESYAELQRIAVREEDNPRYHISNFRLEDFNGPNYKKMSELFLDKMGIFDKKHRKQLLDQMMEHDISNSKRPNAKNNHVTQGSYNKTLQIELLLDEQERCDRLKKQTHDLNYKWMHSDKC